MSRSAPANPLISRSSTVLRISSTIPSPPAGRWRWCARHPELALLYFHAVQEAFYARNRDVTQVEELRRIAAALGLDEAGFAQAFADADARVAVARELAETAALGVSGYPTLLGLKDGRARVLSLGYRPLADVEAALEELAAGG
jgi:putative protein-disulfide isomerase